MRLQRRVELGSLSIRPGQRLFGGLTRALGRFVPLLQDLFERLEEDALQIKLQQDDQNERRRCFEQ